MGQQLSIFDIPKSTIRLDESDINRIYKLYLGFEYGNKQRLISSLSESIKKYKNAPQTPKCLERIALYEAIKERCVKDCG